MMELSEKKFDELIKTSDGDYLSYMELFFVQGETVVARFVGNDIIMLFTNKRIISFYFPISEKANKFFRDYRFIPYKSIQHYSVATGKGNALVGFEISVAGMNRICLSPISQATIFGLSELFNQYIL